MGREVLRICAVWTGEVLGPGVDVADSCSCQFEACCLPASLDGNPLILFDLEGFTVFKRNGSILGAEAEMGAGTSEREGLLMGFSGPEFILVYLIDAEESFPDF